MLILTCLGSPNVGFMTNRSINNLHAGVSNVVRQLDVPTQRRPTGERAFTQGARERFGAAMRPLVMAQMGALRVRLAAHLTHVAALTTVRGGRVPPQLVAGRKAQFAVLALMRRFGGGVVGAHVRSQTDGSGEGSLAVGATMRLGGGANSSASVRQQVGLQVFKGAERLVAQRA